MRDEDVDWQSVVEQPTFRGVELRVVDMTEPRWGFIHVDVLLFDQDGVEVGRVSVCENEDLLVGASGRHRTLHLTDLWIEGRFRRKGLGSHLVRQARRIGALLGHARVWGEVQALDRLVMPLETLLSFYRRLGAEVRYADADGERPVVSLSCEETL